MTTTTLPAAADVVAQPPGLLEQRQPARCGRTVVRNGEEQPCDLLAAFVAFDPEGEQLWPGGGWYATCWAHRGQQLPAIWHNRPDVTYVGGAGTAQALAVSAA